MGSVEAASLRVWTPIRIRANGAEPLVDWAIVDEPFTDPFFEQTVERAMQHPFNAVFAQRTPIGALEDLASVEPGLAPSGLIFHMSRCGSTLVAQMLESIKVVAAIEVPPRYQPRSARDDALRFARTCYDHLAGYVAVAIADALTARGYIALADDGGEVTEIGARFLTGFGVDLTSQPRNRRIFCRPCLDWSERRYHVAGHVGSEICRCCLQLGWFARERDSRALRLTPAGTAGLRDTFGVVVSDRGLGIRDQQSGIKIVVPELIPDC